jgi:hypothetical protein
MRFLHLYLLAYFGLVAGAGLALWQAGVLRLLPSGWIAVAAIVAAGLGIMAAVTAGRPTITRN